MTSLPPLSSLLAFEAVYRTGSVTEAARMLGRTHGAVSKQLRQLHEHSGVALFEKHGAGLMLTDHGRAFAKTVAAALDEIRSGYDTLVASCCRQPVKVFASATFARTWLIPVLSRFGADYPDIDISLQLVGPGGSRDAEGDADLTFSYNRLLSPEIWHGSVPLGDVHMGPVLSPSYAHQLSDAHFTFQTRINRRGAEAMWEGWSLKTGIAIEAQKEVTYDHTYLGFQAARSGMGVVMAPRFLVRSMLDAGELVAPAGFLCFRMAFWCGRPGRGIARPIRMR